MIRVRFEQGPDAPAVGREKFRVEPPHLLIWSMAGYVREEEGGCHRYDFLVHLWNGLNFL